MRKFRAWKMLTMAACGVAIAGVVGLVVEQLWNWLMPALFGLRVIGFWQALGLLILCKILFGGFGKRHGGRRRGAWGARMRGRWEAMTPEEQERFKAGMGREGFGREGFGREGFGRRGCRPFERDEVAAERGAQ